MFDYATLIEIYVPIAIGIHLFVAWHVWHARQETGDAIDYIMAAGDYKEKGALIDDITDMVNNRFAGGAVGAAGDLVGPTLKIAGQKLGAAVQEMFDDAAKKQEQAQRKQAKPAAVVAPEKEGEKEG